MTTPSNSRRLPVVATNTARVIGGLGALSCVLCCVSIPGIAAALSAVGLSFIRNDRFLLPAEAVSLVILVLTLLRSRVRHGRTVPLVLALAAAAWLWFGLRSPAPLGTFAALSGAVAVVAVVVWDWSLQRRCAI